MHGVFLVRRTWNGNEESILRCGFDLACHVAALKMRWLKEYMTVRFNQFNWALVRS